MTASTANRGQRRRAVPFTRRILLIGMLLGLAGCTLPPMQTGERPKIEALASLMSGVSTPQQVRAALGDPRGLGAAHHRPDLPKHKVWYYELVQAKGDQIGLTILLVMFKQDRYDGYFWFKGKELLEGPIS